MRIRFISSPCFEIWLYYHFYENKPVADDIARFASFKEYVNNMISGGFNFEKDPARLEDAITNARNNYSADNASSPLMFASEVYRLGEEIYGFVKYDVAKLKNKLG